MAITTDDSHSMTPSIPQHEKFSEREEQEECLLSSTSMGRDTRKVFFSEYVVTDIIYRVYTPPEDRQKLYYQNEDYTRFRNDCRRVKMDFLEGKRTQDSKQDRVKRDCNVMSTPTSDKRELTCLERVSSITIKLLEAIL
jgi:hypothetical protein